MSAPRTLHGTTASRPSAAALRRPGESGSGAPRAPLSAGQERLWVLAQGEGAASAYNEQLGFRFVGPLDPDVLAAAFDALADRHEIVRTRLVPAPDGTAEQVVDAPGGGFALVREDLTGHPDPAARVAEVQREECAAPFDPAAAPLFRARLLTLGPEEHVLVFLAHHSVFDGWSQNVMLADLGTLYRALSRGEEVPPPPAGLRYADYAREQRAWLALPGEDGPAPHEAYWKRQLTGAPPLLELPGDRPRPPVQDLGGGRVPVLVDAEVTAGLRRFAEGCGVSLYAAVLAGWYLLLARLSGEDDIVVGLPAANRRGRGADDVMGFFVNTLALRVDVAASRTGAALAREVRRALREGLGHVDLPFSRVVQAVNPPRGTGHTPLFQTLCAWVPADEDLMRLPGVTMARIPVPVAHAKFDLALALAERDGLIEGELDYATALFDKATAERFAGFLVRLLAQLAEDPERELASLSLLGPGEERRLLTEWSDGGPGPDVPAAWQGGAVTAFEAQVRERPHAPALFAGGTSLTYAELERRANGLAHALVARGVRHGDVVGLHAGRSPALVAAVLAVWKAGAAYLPLDPAQPLDRLRSMAADAVPAIVLSDAPRTPGGWASLAALEAEGPSGGDAERGPGVGVGAGDLAYVICTSGSTGRPKGVAVTHGSVMNLMLGWCERFGTFPGEAASAWSSTGFDASVHEIVLPLTTGGVLHLVPDALRGDPRELMGWLREHHVVQAFLPPAYVRWIDEAPAERLAGLSLRRLLTGVESLPEAALARLREHLPQLRICYGYGPTEATLYSTAYTDPRPLERPSPIGRPLPGTRLYLLDGRLRPVPAGVVGEVFLGGACLARGYLHRDDLTAERFLPDPFLPGERVYRTGDLARWLPDGTAMYAGRADDQVKLRGFRVEPGEVEAALLRLPGVREAAVLADRDAAGEQRLVAAIASADGAPPGGRRAALAPLLPDHMIPSVFLEVERLPVNRSGKLDRTALLERMPAAPADQVNTASPRDRTEMALHRIWSRVLLHPSVGVRDDFFAVGGTSLSAIKVAHAVREEFGVALPVQDVLRHPTIEALAARLRTGSSAPDAGSLVEFRPGDGGQRVVCVHPAGGTAFCYLPLAAALPASVGVSGIQSPGIEPGERALPSVEAMAREYLRLVAPVPGESLVLCGLSYGGLVAHEMGRMLAAAGHERLSVVLLDTLASDDPAERAAVEPVDAAEFREKLVRFNGMYPGIEDEQVDRYHRIYNHNRMTARDYDVPETFARLVFVQAADASDTADDGGAARDFWRRRAGGGLLVEPVSCGHWDLLESDEIPRVAALIEDELRRTDTPPPAPPAGAAPRTTEAR
ncbi:non-ribosomal peptide synthetase [Streptomyces fuscigenes]|uniref:non-ribosomal peptide synthetase n=1 Tax=Streptomyces fuscigenes TaxID=1528880 RepID=UPI001F4383A3|nr:amino acid adenylation domain-containing protein [Streptomyces fuscigenes]MCF3964046.1 amino acid adenylation domain-containing protein [Streptomyces fuscigenes]